ncbi:uncharacterized protein C1orf87 isoform X2 [Mastacembelus armatus]|uniref:uncharacterized protein C1orf87 isoform X2 n=1 Tax=Mastacembelus armatus TaxID=205130 RepID=UPI000E460613|nr:uncharacterized protein C1orf87 homolog isoform X2 [Mastacembelus armatus]
MAQKNTVPRLVVKIVGSKQVKQFIEEPQVDTHDMSRKKTGNRPAEADHFEKPPEEPRSPRRVQDRGDSGVWAVINQVPDRLCVTAPSGDCSRSYIHPKTLHTGPRAAEEDASEDGDMAELSSAVREELCHWPLSSLTPTEDDVAALDPSFTGTVNRSQITHLFLKNDVPLKLPTFSLLLHMFSDEGDSEQVYYRKLLQFIRRSALPEEPHS